MKQPVLIRWGKSDAETSQGHAYTWDCRNWTAHFHPWWEAHERGGEITYSYANIDDFGSLFALPVERWPVLTEDLLWSC